MYTATPGRFLKRGLFAVGIGCALFLGDYWVNGDLGLLKDHFRRKVHRDKRPKVVILGTGWGALSMLRHLHTDEFDVTVVSPRNYFLFTPLLPSATVGTLEVRSIMEPIRFFLQRSESESAKFFEAECVDVDLENRRVTCADISDVKGEVSQFTIPYDQLVIAVGADTATFGIPGVKEHSVFMRSIDDVQKLRNKVMDCFETAIIPGQPEEEQRRLLSFLVVGGGPAGVEYAGELNDWLRGDIQKAFPEVADKVDIQLIEALPHILNSFEKGLVDYTEQRFVANPHITLHTNAKVVKVEDKTVYLEDMKTGEKSTIPYGMLVWVAGNTPCPLVHSLITKIGSESQPTRRGLAVDEYWRVKGATGLWALGDCANASLPQTAQVAAQTGRYVGNLFNDLSDVMYEDAISNEEHRLRYQQQIESQEIPTEKQTTETPAASLVVQDGVAASLRDFSPFTYHHYGSFAYIGDLRAIADLRKDPRDRTFSYAGLVTFLLWRSVYMSKLLSARNRTLVGVDWLETMIFGRDISRG